MNIRPSKPVQQLQTFGDACGRCNGTGAIDTLQLGFGGRCPVCQGTGISRVFETFGNREVSLPSAQGHYADGVTVISTTSSKRTSRGRSLG
jgi:DnaJ-class molecular chaperone